MNGNHILVIEDEEICAALIETVLSARGYQITTTDQCSEGKRLLQVQQVNYEAILLDRQLPDMDGLSFLKELKSLPHLKDIPVIMETSVGDDQSIQQGLESGAYYYLVKPLQPDLLCTIVHEAIEQYRSQKALQAAVSQNGQHFCQHLDYAVFHFRTIDEARSLAKTLSLVSPTPDKVVVGLQELLINAVEHGNLGITYADKTRLMMESSWLDEIKKRQSSAVHRHKTVEVRLQRTPEKVVIAIEDQGQGFDWQRYLDFDPERAFDPHGRGIALANKVSFSSLRYLGKGNIVEIGIELQPETVASTDRAPETKSI